MLDPKAFYRALDALLARIRLQSDGQRFLPDILGAFEVSFGGPLRFTAGRLYEQFDDGFHKIAGERGALHIGHDDPIVQAIDEHGSYIFDRAEFVETTEDGIVVPAAFAVWRTSTRRWLFVYDLLEGWTHEEISFTINSVRFALNNRLQGEAVKNDMEQAAEIQRSLLPSSTPSFRGFEFAARSIPAESVGGDFFDFIDLGSDVVGISIGDASGHGLPAALLVRDVMTGLRMGMEAQLKMLHTMKRLNRVVHRSSWSSRFLSVFYGEFEQNGNVLYANAGHVSPILFSGTRVVELEPTGTVFGPLPEIPLERNFVRMAPGDVMLLLTDGLPERFSPADEMFGTERIVAFVKTLLNEPASVILDRLFDETGRFGGNAAWADDATAVVVKRLHPAPKAAR